MVQRAARRCPRRRAPDHAADALAVAICHANGAPLRARAGGGRRVIALVRGEVAVRRARPRRRRLQRRRLPARRLRRDAAPRARRPARTVDAAHPPVVRDDALPSTASPPRRSATSSCMLHRRPVGRAEGRARRALRRRRRASCSPRSPPATPRASRPCPGIGKRTAERIIVELREKVGAGSPTATRSSSPAPTTRARSPATASSASASRRRRPTRCSTAPTGETPEDLIAHALRGGPPVSGRPSRAHPDARRLLRRGRARPLAAPAAARGLRRPGGGSRSSSRVSIEAAAARGEALDHVLLAGPPGPRQDLAGADRRRRARGRRSSRPPARRSSARATSPPS